MRYPGELGTCAIQSGGGGGGGGIGGGGGVVGGGGGQADHTWHDYGIFGSKSAPSKPVWQQRRFIEENVPGYTVDCWQDRDCRGTLLQRALDIWIRAKAGDPRSDVFQDIAAGKGGKVAKKYGETLARTAEIIVANRATQPADPQQQLPQLPPNGTGGPEPAWLRLLRLVIENVQKYQAEQLARDQQRAAKKGMRMSLSDSVADILGTVTSVGGQVLPALLQQRAQQNAVKQQLKLAKLTGGSISGVPLSLAGSSGGLMGLLGELGAMDSPDLLEQLGLSTGLEGGVEREATFYVPTASGVRAVPEVQARNPVTGRINTWKNVGRPVLYSGDLATCKRVNKISSRVSRVARARGVVRRRRR